MKMREMNIRIAKDFVTTLIDSYRYLPTTTCFNNVNFQLQHYSIVIVSFQLLQLSFIPTSTLIDSYRYSPTTTYFDSYR